MTADGGSGGLARAAVIIGRIAGPFGIQGEAKVDTADPADFRVGLEVRARRPDGQEVALVVRALRPHQRRLLIRFEGLTDPEAVSQLHGAALSAWADELPPLDPGSFRDDDLVGMTVVDARLGELGEVESVMHYPHADMLVVGKRSMLVPLLAAYQVAIDPAARRIATSLPLGFEDL